MKDKEYFNIIIQHKLNVAHAGIKIANEFFKEHPVMAKRVMLNCFNHDNRKVSAAIEFMHLRSADSEKFQEALDSHRKNSKHHFQYWDDITEIPLDVIGEMVCDWYARSCEMGTSLQDYVNDVLDKYAFTENQEGMIQRCIGILTRPPFGEGD